MGMLVMSDTALCFVYGFVKSNHCFKLFQSLRTRKKRRFALRILQFRVRRIFFCPRRKSTLRLVASQRMISGTANWNGIRFEIYLACDYKQVRNTKINSEMFTTFTVEWVTR